MRRFETDIAIVGTGGAGMRAAIEAGDNGAKVLMISKSLHRKAHTVMAEGGIAAALGNMDPKDNWRVHANDTLADGIFLGNRKMVETLAREARDRILELDGWGAVFDRTNDGKIHQRPFGAHTYSRVCHIGDRTGLEIIQVLADQARKRKIDYLEEVVVTNLLKTSGKVSGLIGVDIVKGEFVVVSCKAIILSTGGYAKIYKTSTNPWECTGDGYAMAYNNGVELVDMEMVQFHPTGMIFPESARGILVTESVRGDGGLLTNSKGERFMKRYDKKRMELSARDIVARAIHSEIKAGRGTERGGVYLDISHKPKEYIEKRLPKMIQQFKDFAGVDITKERMEVAPTAHYTMGGIRVDPSTTMTTLPGLFAAGETAVSVHGANRLGGNSLIDIVVFGRIAGLHAAKYAKKNKQLKIKDLDVKKETERLKAPFKNKGNVKPQALRDELQELMQTHAGIERDEKGLKEALKKLEAVKHKAKNISVSGTLKFNHEFTYFIDLHNMMVCAEATIRGALERKESRGAHTRSDHPKTKDSWLLNISVYRSKSGMKLKRRKILSKKGF